MSRILVVAAAGMLGHKLFQELPRRGHDVVGTVRHPEHTLARLAPAARLIQGVDVLEGDFAEPTVRDVRPDFAINAVRIVKQRETASNKYLSTAINAWLPQRLERVCREVGSTSGGVPYATLQRRRGEVSGLDSSTYQLP